MITSSGGKAEPCYPQAVLDTLFDAILVNDIVDAATELPNRITLDFDEVLLSSGYRMSRQLWADGDNRGVLTKLVERLQRSGDLDAEERLAFKHARAKLKHVRFAYALFGAAHRYPPVLNGFTVALGRLQDAYRVGDHRLVARHARRCRLLLSAVPQALLDRELDHVRFVDGAGFRTYVARQIGSLRAMSASPTITGAGFHAMRKIVSRQGCLYNILLALRPDQEAHQMARSLAAINGLMGNEHDRLIERKISSEQDYHGTPIALSQDIRDRIAPLIDRYETSGLFGFNK